MMDRRRILTLSITALASSLSLGLACNAFANEGRRITWEPRSQTGSLIILQAAIEGGLPVTVSDGRDASDLELSKASCVLDATRPAHGVAPFADEQNKGLCQVVLQDGTELEAVIDFSQVPMGRWGNRFYPKGIRFEEEPAAKFYGALEQLLGTYSDLLDYAHVRLSNAAFFYEYEEIKLRSDPHPEDGVLAVASCGKEWDYPVNMPRPEQPTRWYCDFIHQFHFDGIVD